MNYKFSNRAMHMRRSPLRENAKKNLDITDGISFSYGFPPMAAFPMEQLAKISQYLYTKVDPELFLQYGPADGYTPLKNIIKQRLSNKIGISQATSYSENVLITSGSTQAMDLVVRILCNEGDQVLCEEQTFSGAVNNIRSYGAEPVPIPMDIKHQSIDLVALEKLLIQDVDHKIKLIYVIPTFQNPLGTTMPLDARQQLYRLAKRFGVLIFEDDPYGELIYSGKPLPKVKSLDDDGLVIYAGSFSKVFAPGTRIGCLLANKEIIKKLILAKQVADSHSNFYWQIMITEYIKQFDLDEHIEHLKDLYRNKLSVMTTKLDEISDENFSYIKPTGGYFIGCTISDQVDPSRFYDYLNDKKVSIIPGDVMSVTGTGYERCFRLNFTKPTKAEIQQGIEAIGRAVKYALVSNRQSAL